MFLHYSRIYWIYVVFVYIISAHNICLHDGHIYTLSDVPLKIIFFLLMFIQTFDPILLSLTCPDFHLYFSLLLVLQQLITILEGATGYIQVFPRRW